MSTDRVPVYLHVSMEAHVAAVMSRHDLELRTVHCVLPA